MGSLVPGWNSPRGVLSDSSSSVFRHQLNAAEEEAHKKDEQRVSSQGHGAPLRVSPPRASAQEGRTGATTLATSRSLSPLPRRGVEKVSPPRVRSESPPWWCVMYGA